MNHDEEGTLARLKRHRREMIEPTIQEHFGRVIKTTGDGFLAMFDSPLEAVRCAIVIQQSMAARNTSLPSEQWIRYRIGVNLGDVIVDPTFGFWGASFFGGGGIVCGPTRLLAGIAIIR